MPEPTVAVRASKIKLLILDIDGVLTSGHVVYDSEGREIKFFDVTDGHGMKLLMRTGVEIALLSGRKSEANRVRAKDLGITELVEDTKIKLPAFEKLAAKFGIQPEEAAFMGDDLIDLPPMRAAGLALAPASARPEALAAAHWVSKRSGGRGAVRDACELILRAQGTWDEVTARYF